MKLVLREQQEWFLDSLIFLLFRITAQSATCLINRIDFRGPWISLGILHELWNHHLRETYIQFWILGLYQTSNVTDDPTVLKTRDLGEKWYLQSLEIKGDKSTNVNLIICTYTFKGNGSLRWSMELSTACFPLECPSFVFGLHESAQNLYDGCMSTSPNLLHAL